MEPMLLRVREAAEVAAVSRSHAYLLIKLGVWPSVRIGTAIRVPVDRLRAWIDSQAMPDDVMPGVYLDVDEEGEPRLVRK